MGRLYLYFPPKDIMPILSTLHLKTLIKYCLSISLAHSELFLLSIILFKLQIQRKRKGNNYDTRNVKG